MISQPAYSMIDSFADELQNISTIGSTNTWPITQAS